MKRSRSINITRMRKAALLSTSVKPMALAVTAVTLAACSSNEPTQVFQSVEQCVQAGVGSDEECQKAYDDALLKAQETGPKYSSLANCQLDFGTGQCVQYQNNSGQSWFVPLMAGYIIGDIIGGSSNYRYYNSAPLYTSYSHRSPFFGQWTTVDGYTYGSVRDRSIRVPKKTWEPKPVVNRTIKRGGFGSKVNAKSNWGGGAKRSGGWGG